LLWRPSGPAAASTGGAAILDGVAVDGALGVLAGAAGAAAGAAGASGIVIIGVDVADFDD